MIKIINPTKTKQNKNQTKQTMSYDYTKLPHKFGGDDYDRIVDECINWPEFVRQNEPSILPEDTAKYDGNCVCYCCDNCMLPKDAHNVTFRYKPNKPHWNDEPVCKMCFHALQCYDFDYFKNGCYGYLGILIKYKDDWIYRDLSWGASCREYDRYDYGNDFRNLDCIDGPCVCKYY